MNIINQVFGYMLLQVLGKDLEAEQLICLTFKKLLVAFQN